MTLKKIHLLFVPLLGCLWLAGCSDEEKTRTDSVYIGTAPVTVKAAAGKRSVTIFTTCDWTAEADGWITPDPASGGRGIHAVVLDYGANDTGVLRSGTVTFTAGAYIETYVLSQEAE